MHPADIKAALQKKGMRPAAVARKFRVAPGVISQVIYGKCSSRRIARFIATTINQPVGDLWPDRYPDLELAEIRGTRRAA